MVASPRPETKPALMFAPSRASAMVHRRSSAEGVLRPAQCPPHATRPRSPSIMSPPGLSRQILRGIVI
jgi:hypothetical protein